MINNDDSAELPVDQSQTGTLLLAALFGILSTFIVATVTLALFWQIATLAG